MGEQSNWRFCFQCNAMFWNGYAGGVCSAGGTHTPQGVIFNLPHSSAATASAQDNWRFCKKCNVMFFTADGGNNCAAGGTHSADWLMFVLPHDVAPAPTTQKDWRFCEKCSALYFAGAGFAGGICPAGGRHSFRGFIFVLPFTQPGPGSGLIIAINPSAIKWGADEINAATNPGHTIVALTDSIGSLKKVFSYGPVGSGGVAGAISCSAPGQTNYHLLKNDEYKLYQFSVTSEQYKRAQAKMEDIERGPGTFDAYHQCTTTSLEVVEAAGISAPSGKGNIFIPVPGCADAKGVSAPAFLDRELQAQFGKEGKPIRRVKGIYFTGFVPIQEK